MSSSKSHRDEATETTQFRVVKVSGPDDPALMALIEQEHARDRDRNAERPSERRRKEEV